MKNFRQFLIAAFHLLIFQNTFAQDSLFLKSGIALPVIIKRETDREVYYMKSMGDDSQFLILKNDLQKIKYANGYSVVLSTQTTGASDSIPNGLESAKKLSKKPVYHFWIFGDSTFSFRTRKGYLHNVNDSGIVFSVASFGNDFISKDRQLNFIDARNIQKIKIRQKGSVVKGFLIGAGFGFLLGGLLGLSGITEYGLFDKLPAEQNALAGGIVFGIPGLLIGGLAGTYRIKIPIHKSIEKYKSHKEWITGYVNSKY